MSDGSVSPEDRIAAAVQLIDVWLHDESKHDSWYQRMVWGHVREVRATLTGGPNP